MTDSTPLARLRALHEPILCPDCGSDEHCGYCGNETWPCDTIAALDALEAELTETRSVATSHYMQLRDLGVKNADMGNETVDALQARLDAATVLIRQAMFERHHIDISAPFSKRHCGASLGTRIDTCPNCAPYRAWLAGDKEGTRCPS